MDEWIESSWFIDYLIWNWINQISEWMMKSIWRDDFLDKRRLAGGGGEKELKKQVKYLG